MTLRSHPDGYTVTCDHCERQPRRRHGCATCERSVNKAASPALEQAMAEAREARRGRGA